MLNNHVAMKDDQSHISSSKKAASIGNVTDRLWVSGVAGALSIIVLAYWFNVSGALRKGVVVFDIQLTSQRIDTVLLALVFSTLVMCAVEFLRLLRRDKKQFFSLSPWIKQKQYGMFISECSIHYVIYLSLLFLAISFFQSASEYGFLRNAPYYQAWFRCLEWFWLGYLYLGLPYVLLTRAVKHEVSSDQRDVAVQIIDYLLHLKQYLLSKQGTSFTYKEQYKKSLLSLLVKLFFAPLMTVFFVDQFPHLVNNVSYVLTGIPSQITQGAYTLSHFNTDLFNISVALIFSIDVAIAWCGYIISSRWVDNQTRSTEPTLLGWVVCLCCYPPFQWILSLYYVAPNERAILNFPQAWLVTVLTVMMVLSYGVYMLSTLYFGVRFSNLTHRGIIQTGPYAWVRHPAYAAKNFAWWCVMFPVVLITAHSVGIEAAIMQILGLLIMTWLYYLRAKTEERHLLQDPSYVDYCQRVKYRFIPGLV